MSDYSDAPVWPFEPGTVIRYKSERPNSWCREGMAVVTNWDRAFDTYWQSGGDQHELTDSEWATAKKVFDLHDFYELTPSTAHTWRDYHPADRQVITSQHGLQRRLFIRYGANPDLGTRVSNAREAVRDAEDAVRSAKLILQQRQADLARLEGR